MVIRYKYRHENELKMEGPPLERAGNSNVHYEVYDTIMEKLKFELTLQLTVNNLL